MVARRTGRRASGAGVVIPISKPVLGEPEAVAARRAVLSGWVTQGPEVAAFEREFAAYVGAAHACAVSNCTAALHLALDGVGVGPGDEVITASHSFIATANAIRHCGAVPVFVDIRPDTFNLDPAAVAAAIGPRTRAILCVHQLGLPCDLAAILALARPRGLAVVEDAACAIGSEIAWGGAWQRIGRPHGDVACFSFHPRKVVTTGDGGMLTTSDPGLDRRFRLLRQHAMSIPDTVRHGSPQVLAESYPSVGYNYRLTDVQAAIGRAQLARLPGLVAERRRLADTYRQLLANLPEVEPPHEPAGVRSNWQSYCVRLPAQVDQAAVMQAMLDRGVATRRGIMCAHREPAYRDLPRHHALNNSEAAQDGCLLLPLYPGLTVAHLVVVVEALGAAVDALVGSWRTARRDAAVRRPYQAMPKMGAEQLGASH
jgi:perosamine synthetase